MNNYIDDNTTNSLLQSEGVHALLRANGCSIQEIETDEDLDSPLLNDQHDIHSNHSTFSVCSNGKGFVHGPSNSTKKAQKKLLAVTLLCSMFMITELVGGYMAGSLAIMSDAAHLLSDCIGFAVALLALWLGEKPPDKNMTFGYKRAEVLGATCSVLGIWLLTGILLYMAAYRLYKGDYDIAANTMMIVSGIGVIFNIIMGILLHGGCQDLMQFHNPSHSHLHDSSHHHLHDHYQNSISDLTHNFGMDPKVNINVRAAIIHVLGDLIQSCGVFIAAVIIKCYPSAKMADPLCTFVFSIIVLFTTVGVLRESIYVLMEGTLHEGSTAVQAALLSLPGVLSVHCLNVWCLSSDTRLMSAHLVIENNSNPEVILNTATLLIRNEFKFNQSTIQIEKIGLPVQAD